MHSVSHEIRRALDIRIAARVTPELSGVRGMVLGRIACSNEQGHDVYQRDVENWFNIRRSSVTAMLKGLEQDGFIVRSSVAKDARLKRLTLTEKGDACRQHITACIDDFEREIQANLSPQELENMKATLMKLRANMQAIAAAQDDCAQEGTPGTAPKTTTGGK